MLKTNKNRMNRFLQKNRIQIIVTILGAIGGFLYWKFIGCESGTCAIKSVWYYSTLWGALAGYLVGDIISGLLKRKKKDESSL